MKHNAYEWEGKVLFFEYKESGDNQKESNSKIAMPAAEIIETMFPEGHLLRNPGNYINLMMICFDGEKGVRHKDIMDGASKTDKKWAEQQLEAMVKAGMISFDPTQNRYFGSFNVVIDDQQQLLLKEEWSSQYQQLLQHPFQV